MLGVDEVQLEHSSFITVSNGKGYETLVLTYP